METTQVERSPRSRLWSARLAWHTAALAAVLVIIGLLVGPSASFSSDEGAVLLQAKSLGEGHGWLVTNPLVSLDPTGEHFPIKLPDGGPVVFAPYARHPLHPLLVTPVLDHLGVIGVVLLSIAAAVAAALAASRLAALVDDRLARPALWVAGLGSQLFFDAQLVMAHTLVAALCGWATVVAVGVAAAPPDRRRSPVAGALAVGGTVVLTGLAVLLRSEAVLFGLALAAVLVVAGWRLRRRLAMVAGAVTGVATVGLLLAERRWYASILNGTTGAPPSGVGVAPLTKAASAAWSLIGPVRDDPGLLAGVATGALVLVAMAGFLIRRSAPDLPAAAVFLGLAAAVGLIGLAVAEPDPITGVLPAFPALVFALVLWRRNTLRDPVVAMMAAVAALYTVGVLLTSYEVGGGAEWGGRYFAAGFPVVAALVVISIGRALSWSDPAARRCVMALTAVSLSFVLLGVHQLRWTHQLDDARTDALAAMVDAAGPTSGPDLGDGDRRPIVVETNVDAGRFAWDQFDRTRGIQAADANVDQLLTRLAGAGATSAVIQSDDLDAAIAEVQGSPGWRVAAQAAGLPGHGGALLVHRS